MLEMAAINCAKENSFFS